MDLSDHAIEGNENRCRDRADDRADDNDQERFERGAERRGAGVDIDLIIFRDLEKHRVERAGFFADTNESDDEWVEEIRALHAVCDAFAVANGGSNLKQGLGVERASANRCCDFKCAQNVDAGGE